MCKASVLNKKKRDYISFKNSGFSSKAMISEIISRNQLTFFIELQKIETPSEYFYFEMEILI